jgi:ubiquinone/menaquinone biosynthesis C-methylase UbiE
MRGHRRSNVLFSAFELGILDKLNYHSYTTKELAKALDLSEDGLERMMDALRSLGIIDKQGDENSLNKRFGHFFNKESRVYIGNLIEHEIHLQLRWFKLSQSVRSGKPAKKKKQTKADKTRFINAMANIGEIMAPVVLDNLALKGDERILDLGGGPGKYMQAFCEKYAQTQVTLLDQPESIAFAQKYLSDHSAYDRMHFIAGDFFEQDFGANFDVIFLSNVIHIYGPEEILRILKKCYQALNYGGRLIIKDNFFYENQDGPEFTALFSLHMLLSTETGRCYKPNQLYQMMTQVKFKPGETLALTDSSLILEGFKIKN